MAFVVQLGHLYCGFSIGSMGCVFGFSNMCFEVYAKICSSDVLLDSYIIDEDLVSMPI